MNNTQLATAAVNHIAQVTGVSVDDILGESRKRSIVTARHWTIWLLHRQGMKPSMIGRMLQLNHNTVLNALRQREA